MSRREPKPGQYFVMPGGGFAGWLVRHGTESPYGHAGLVMPNGETMEARGRGVSRRSLEQVLREGAIVCDEPLADDFLTRVVKWAYAHEGAPYDHAVNVSIAFDLIVGLRSPLLPVGSKGAFNCSQFVSVGYTECGKALFPTVDRWRVSPRLLADRITTRPWLDV